MQRIQLHDACRGVALAAVILTSFLGGCTTSSRTLPAPAQLVASGVVPPQVGEDSLGRGRTLAITECSTCHRFYWPEEYSPQEWPGIIRKMGRRASLTENQIEDVQSYFLAASSAARGTAPEGSNVRTGGDSPEQRGD